MVKSTSVRFEVVAGGQPGLEAETGEDGLGQDDALGLDAHGAGRAQGVDPGVGVARVDEDLLVLLEPGVEGRPFEADGVVEPFDLGGAEDLRRVRTVDVTDPQAEDLARPPRCLLVVPSSTSASARRRPAGCSTAGNCGHSHT